MLIKGLTTGACAAILNELAGMEVYTADFLRGQIDAGLFPMARSVKVRAIRRTFIRVHPLDFRDYIATHHRAWLDAFDARDVPREKAS